jgi:hypothetical protein
VRLEVGDRHLAGEQERHGARKETEHYQRTAEYLEDAREPELREHRRRPAPRPARRVDE